MTLKEKLEQIKIAHVEEHITSKNDADFDVWFEDDYEEIEQALTELEELKRDVKRFMELMPEVKFRPLQDEAYLLQQKLSKVGKEDV